MDSKGKSLTYKINIDSSKLQAEMKMTIADQEYLSKSY
jgi:hypothetical protein